jgi:lactam utilization protein B
MPKRPTDAFNAANVASVDVRIRVFNDRRYHPDGTPKTDVTKGAEGHQKRSKPMQRTEMGMGEMM